MYRSSPEIMGYSPIRFAQTPALYDEAHGDVFHVATAFCIVFTEAAVGAWSVKSDRKANNFAILNYSSAAVPIATSLESWASNMAICLLISFICLNFVFNRFFNILSLLTTDIPAYGRCFFSHADFVVEQLSVVLRYHPVRILFLLGCVCWCCQLLHQFLTLPLVPGLGELL